MHPIATVKHWSHDGMRIAWHHIDQHLHSSRFWVGVGITLLVVGLLTLLVILSKNAPIPMHGAYPYGMPHTY